MVRSHAFHYVQKRRNGTDAVPSATPISKKRRSSWDVRSIESRQEKDSGSQHIASTSQHTVDTTHTNMTVLQSLSLSNIVCDGKRVPNSPSKLQKMIITKNNEIIFKSQSNGSKFFKLVPRHSIRTLEVSHSILFTRRGSVTNRYLLSVLCRKFERITHEIAWYLLCEFSSLTLM
jgi:hypothetical protein